MNFNKLKLIEIELFIKMFYEVWSSRQPDHETNKSPRRMQDIKGRPRSRAVTLRIILAFHMALIYYTQDFRVYKETRDQPMPGPFPAPPIFGGKSPGDEVVLNIEVK